MTKNHYAIMVVVSPTYSRIEHRLVGIPSKLLFARVKAVNSTSLSLLASRPFLIKPD